MAFIGSHGIGRGDPRTTANDPHRSPRTSIERFGPLAHIPSLVEGAKRSGALIEESHRRGFPEDSTKVGKIRGIRPAGIRSGIALRGAWQ
jgi:hypothetical protein